MTQYFIVVKCAKGVSEMAQGILLVESGIIEVNLEDGYYQVRYGFHKFAWFHTNDAAAKR